MPKLAHLFYCSLVNLNFEPDKRYLRNWLSYLISLLKVKKLGFLNKDFKTRTPLKIMFFLHILKFIVW